MTILSLMSAADKVLVRAVEIERKTLSTGVIDTLYYADNRLVTKATDSPAHTTYDHQLSDPGNYSKSLSVPGSPGLVGPLGANTGGNLKIAQDRGNLDSDFDPSVYSFDGLEARLYLTGYSATLTGGQLDKSAWECRRMSQGKPMVDLDEVSLPLKDPMSFLNDPLQTRVFRGTGNCLNLNSGANVGFGTPAGLDTSTLTICGWLWPKAISGPQRILTWDNTATTYSYELRINSSGNLWFNSSNYSSSLTTTEVLLAAEWYHVAVVRSGATITFTIYRESTDTQIIEVKTASTSTPDTSNGTLSLGRASSGFIGMLDSFSVYSSARTESQIQDIRLRPLKASDFIGVMEAHWPLNETSGSSVPDSTSNGVSGTVAGSKNWFPTLEGDENLQGTIKRDVWGQPDHVPCIKVDSLTEIYYIHGGKIQSVTPKEGGLPLVSGNNYGNLLSFLSTTTTAGEYDRYIAGPNASVFRLGSSPSLPIAADVQGEAGGGGFVSSAGEISERVVTTRGRAPLSSSDLDTSAWTTIKSDNTNPSYFVGSSNDTIGTILSSLLGATLGANYTKTEAGLLTVKRWEGAKGSSVLTLDKNNVVQEKLRAVKSTQQLWKITALCHHNFLKLSENQISASLSTSTELFFERDYSTRTAQDRDTYNDNNNSETIEVDMNFLSEDAALDECERRLLLFNGHALAYTLVVDTGGIEINTLDKVTLDIQDLDVSNVLQNRLWTSGGVAFTVFGIVPYDPGSGHLTRMVIYREKP